VLPIELMDFSAVKKDAVVLLEWSTASEINNQYFELERSIDGIDFHTIKKMNGAGNSNSILEYSYIDDSPLNGVNYYRLKQTDFDGEFSFSNIRAVRMESGEISIYPNPTSGLVNIENYSKLKSISITDVNGKLLRTFNSSDGPIDFSGLMNGIYFLRIETATETISKKVVKR